jgi:hypothetical protein
MNWKERKKLVKEGQGCRASDDDDDDDDVSYGVRNELEFCPGKEY